MRAAWIDAFGGPENIRVGEHLDPTRKTGETLVRMHAATLNHHDIYLRRGEAGRVSLPVVLGSDGAGVVLESDAEAVRAGDHVAIYPVLACGVCRECRRGMPHKCVSFGMVGGERDGTHAELVAVPNDCVVPLPSTLDFETAASISLAGLTAWNMVMDEGHVQKGDHALVLGASGGVGVFTVLLLKSLGAAVHAVTSSPAKRQRLLELGADTVLDDQPMSVLRHTRQLPERGVDHAFNCVGGTTWRYVPAAVRTGGKILVCGTVRSPVAEIDMRQIFYRSISLIGCTMGTPRALARMLDAAAADPAFRAPIHDVIGLDGLADAHRRMEAGRLTGKIVLQLA